jgi:hypothetical protein
VKATDPVVGANTVTESSGSEKAGSGGPPLGQNPSTGSLDRVRVDSTDRALSTNQGVPVADNQHSLKAGLRGPTLLEDFILPEKITHFDHERIPERIVHARLGSAFRKGDRSAARVMAQNQPMQTSKRRRQNHGKQQYIDRPSALGPGRGIQPRRG